MAGAVALGTLRVQALYACRGRRCLAGHHVQHHARVESGTLESPEQNTTLSAQACHGAVRRTSGSVHRRAQRMESITLPSNTLHCPRTHINAARPSARTC